jgi:hypothetical protein
MRHASASSVRLAVISMSIVASLTAASTGALAGGPQSLSGPAPAHQRPLSEFLSAQGNTFVAWEDNPATEFAVVDYMGVLAAQLLAGGGADLGTQVSGSVLERPLADGRAELTVTLHATNALTYSRAVPSNIMSFGYTVSELEADHSLTPGLSTTNLKFVFTNTAPGDPIPSLINILFGTPLPGQQVLQIKIESAGFGPLRAASGFPDGTPGKCSVVQTGNFIASGQGATADGFPVENITLTPTLGHAAASPVSLGGAGLDPTASDPAATTGASTFSTQHTSWGRIKALYH